MEQFLSSLDNREISILIWLLMGLIWMLFYEKPRSTFTNSLKILFDYKLLTIFGSIIIYSVCIIFMLNEFNFWEPGLLKETIICILSIGIMGVVEFESKTKSLKQHIRSLIFGSIKLIVLIQFFTSFYVLSLIAELILIPFLFVLAALHTVSSNNEGRDNSYLPVTKLLSRIIAIATVSLLIFSTIQFIDKPQNLLTILNLKELLLPIIMTLFYIPVLTLISVVSAYINFYLLLDRVINNKQMVRYAKLKVFLKCKFDLSSLNILRKNLPWAGINTKEELIGFLQSELR